jgi:hypothetical protein
MAIFEKKYEHKIEIDDTTELTVKIETHQNINNHTVNFGAQTTRDLAIELQSSWPYDGKLLELSNFQFVLLFHL